MRNLLNSILPFLTLLAAFFVAYSVRRRLA